MIILLTSSNFDKKVHTKCHIQVSVTPPRSQVATCDMGHWTCDDFILWYIGWGYFTVDSLIVNLEVLFATLLEKLFWGFQWSRGFMLWPNKAMNTKFYVRTFLGPFNNQNCWNCWNCQQSHHETNTGFSVRSMFPLPRCIYMSWSAAASLSTNQNPKPQNLYAAFSILWPVEADNWFS